MREIKFRVWDNGCNMYQEMAAMMNVHTGSVSDLPSRHILEQYAGLKDESGKEIYEGDIILYDIQDHNGTDHFYTGAVIYECGQFGCKGENDDYWFFHSLADIVADDLGIEILGNIHENGDLLK